MKTSELFKNNKTVFSCELFPPKKSGNLETVIRALKSIKDLSPDFISVTYGAGGKGAETTADVASIAKDAFDLETVAHLTAVNMTTQKLEEQIAMLKRKGIENILVLRGDVIEGSEFFDFHHANELASYIKNRYPSLNLLGACYPEKHTEANSLEDDIEYMKLKEQCGVSHFLSQLFFDNEKFYRFRDLVSKKGITSPIEAGIMPVFSRATIKKMLALSNAKIPRELQRIIDDESIDIYKEGIDFAVRQIEDLIKNGVQGIHLYSMNRGDVATAILGCFSNFRGLK